MLTISFATAKCPDFDSVPNLLSHYKLPAGLFPADVENFECNPIKAETLKLTIRLTRVGCHVNTTDFNAAYEQTISATIFENNLTDVEGFMAIISDKQPLVPVTEVEAFFSYAIQFNTTIGLSPVYLFENLKKPSPCTYDSELLAVA
ncbi:hypothetical protein BVRB_7g160520 [Beta vulgaris subsp. vulgaris]|nr:hypothetical protein BVRB_7g160520 [Beta vulgaris subsp. vulgaris]